ncbi:MAG TPA: bifunctional phosphoglucose/phosphomannose isomerase [Bacteroidia bacterium]|nr:bifunctional phosphoglucose/phosphomannose isomerase [Bacteroidia bacterium]HNU32361.1 bifunctional phosphoglucose/phosphomannose isomerase [Bacteroidia bacterium]
MKERIENFTNQMREAIAIGEKATFSAPKNEIRNVLVTGLGGSGIGGTIIAQICEKELGVPLNVSKDYSIPNYVNEHTLLIASSYSGNTEETLESLEMALKQKAKIVCVTSGGKVLEIAKQNGLDHIIIPGGMPPRSCLGYSLTQLFYVLQGMKLIGSNFKADLQKSVELMDSERENIKRDSRALAEKLIGKIPVIYSAANYEGVTVRLRQQIDENSKMLCWHHVFPEMNHNELVGWTEKHDDVAVIMFRNKDDYFRTQKRMDICKEIFAKYTPHIHEIWSKGDTQLQKSMYLIHYGDWISWYIAEIKNIDAIEVKVIDYLKGELSKI